MITMDVRDNVAVVKLNRGVTNALNLELLETLAETLRKVKQDSSVHALVLGSSNNKFFSIGWDLPGLYDLKREEFILFYNLFNRTCLDLYTMPKPVIAALTGHATAGGCILALCCDYRFIAEGKKMMGLNEIKLGVPVPYLADRILYSITGVPNGREIMETGDFYRPEQAARMNLVDEILPLDSVLPKAIEKAQLLGSMPAKAFELIKNNRVETVIHQVREKQEEKDNLFLECWYSGEARQRLKDAMKTFKK